METEGPYNHNDTFSSTSSSIREDEYSENGELGHGTSGSGNFPSSRMHYQRTNPRIGNQATNQEPEVLQPDNPLMIRFQAALKSHLTKQRKKLQEEIIGLKLTLKENQKDFQDNIEVRDLEQQAVVRQNIALDKERETIDKLILDREKIEENLKNEIIVYKDTTDHLNNKTNKEEELRQEKESLSTLISQFSEWEQSQNSEITISQRISEKNKTDKNIYTQEKIYQDLLLVSLTSEVLSLNTKFVELEKNIKQKQSEVETISQSVADGNADLEALERENKRLLQIWNHVILQIQQRDRVLSEFKHQLLSSQEEYSRLVYQVESFKRSSADEMRRNETLTQSVRRFEGDIEVLERNYALEEEKQKKLNETLNQVANSVEFTQMDLNSAIANAKEKEAKCKMVQVDIDKLQSIKFQLEEQLLAKLHEQVVLGKAEKQSTKMIANLRTNARKLETQLAKAQNELARVLLLIEQENKQMKEQTGWLEEEKAADFVRERELKNSEAGLKHLETIIKRKQGQTDAINTKLAELKEKAQGGDLTPDEMYIARLEKSLTETTNNIEDLQSLWMREQSRIVTLTHQRNNLLNQLNVFHKQILVMKQKHLKIEFEIENHKKEEVNMMRLITTLEKRLTSLNLQCSQRKGYKEALDNQNLVSQNHLICDLKDAEVKALNLQEEMCVLEIDKEELRGKIGEMQRDLLAWEKKLQMATEIKQSIDRARADGGEIAVMKSEIHRMEVRYAQLQKVQEKLAHDMEMCISRRDGIVELAQAREKRSSKRALYTRQQFLKKLDDLQNKIKQTNSDIKSVDKSCISSEEDKERFVTKEQIKKEQLAELQRAVTQMQTQLAEGHLHRQKNLELLVRKQRKARQYGEFKAGRYSLQFRQENAIDHETQKQKSVNSDLVSIVESLKTDFPVLETPVTQIMNTLHSPAA